MKLFHRHCERSEAIQCGGAVLDCFVASLLAMTMVGSAALLVANVGAMAQEFSDPYSIIAPERVQARHHVHKSPPSGEKAAARHATRKHAVIARGSPGVVLPASLPRTALIPPEGGTALQVQSAPQQQGVTVLPGVANPIPNLPHGPETFQDRASRCAFQQQLYNVPGNLGPQYMGACLQ